MTILCLIAGPTVVLREAREPERWCFRCRKRHAGTSVLLDYAEPSYYDPIWQYRCDGCHGDHRLFPGWEWAEN